MTMKDEMIELSGAALDAVAGGAKGDMGVDPVDAPDAPDAPGQAKKVK